MIQHNNTGLLKWIALTISIIFSVFLSLFAIETFVVTGGSIEQTIANLYPTIIVLVTTIIAWHKPKTGGNLFIWLGTAYIVMGWGNFNWLLALSVIFLPLFLIGFLFLMQGWNKDTQ